MTPTKERRAHYHLRFQIIPGANVERDARILARFCREHEIEEAVLFVAAEEWNNGLLSPHEEDAWFDAVARTKPILEKAGVVCSLNPWMTVLHADRGRRFPRTRKFAPMVSPAGEASTACASFADPAWREYVRRLYGRFARLGFRVLWVEDDFRYHNHEPLTWGGGFEPEMIARFEKLIGRKTSREEVVANILKPGRPHPWRKLWQETWRETQLEVAAALAGAVEANAPKMQPSASRLGLMSSNPNIHSAEGRDWHKLFEALSIGGLVAHRPAYASYVDWPGQQEVYGIMKLDVQRGFRPEGVEVAPEVENYPFTAWSKSDSLTWAQMAMAQFYGSDALLLDVFPFSGNPADREPEVGALLTRSRPALDWIAARFTPDLPTRGVGIPWKTDAMAHVRTRAGKSLTEFNATTFGAGRLLLNYGVPVSARAGEVNAIFGSLAWAFSDVELEQMLAGGLMLDGAAAKILHQRGYGAEIGLAGVKMLARENSLYSVEEVLSDKAGAPVGHFFNINLAKAMAALRPRSGAEEWTRIITPERKRLGAGLVCFRNQFGGRVCTWAAPDPAALAMSGHRQSLVRAAVRFLCGGHPPFATVTGGPHLLPLHLGKGQRQFFVVFNGSPDPARPVIHLPAGVRVASATLLHPLAEPQRVRLTRARGELRSAAEVPYLGYLVVEMR